MPRHRGQQGLPPENLRNEHGWPEVRSGCRAAVTSDGTRLQVDEIIRRRCSVCESKLKPGERQLDERDMRRERAGVQA
jgi:hypothetical protein